MSNTPADGTTFGFENEFRVYGKDLREVAYPGGWDAIAGEVNASMGEFNSGVVEFVSPVFKAADARRQILLCERQGLKAFAATGYPTNTSTSFDGRNHPEITNKDRYVTIVKNLSKLRVNTLTGMHFHIGVADKDQRVQVAARLSEWSHVLVALTAASPVVDGKYTFEATSRVPLFGEIHSVYDMPEASTWDEYNANLEIAMNASDVARIKEGPRAGERDRTRVHPWVRVVEAYPTIELRLFDNGITVEDRLFAFYLAAGLTNSIIFDVQNGRPKETKLGATWTHRSLRTWAAKHGMEDNLHNPLTNKADSAWEVVDQLFERVRDGLTRIEMLEYLDPGSLVNEFEELAASTRVMGTGAQRVVAQVKHIQEQVAKQATCSREDLITHDEWLKGLKSLGEEELNALIVGTVWENHFGGLTAENDDRNAEIREAIGSHRLVEGLAHHLQRAQGRSLKMAIESPEQAPSLMVAGQYLG